jgi:hypothetical protein
MFKRIAFILLFLGYQPVIASVSEANQFGFSMENRSGLLHFVRKDGGFSSCTLDPDLQAKRSHELQTIAEADQKAREHWENWETQSVDDISKFFNEDLQRRKRVGEIFGEGCIRTASDFGYAALVYQHGEIPDHFYQAHLWARRAVELGDTQQKHMVALTIDRYLVKSGKKQLFGSQATFMNGCYCMEPVESTVPDSLRAAYDVNTLSEQYLWIASLNQKRHCQTMECPKTLEPSPAGTVPGLW